MRCFARKSTKDPSRSPDSTFVSIQDVHSRDCNFVDGTWYHKGEKNRGKKFFLEGPRIKGAAYFDLDDICNSESSWMHMLPSKSLVQAWYESCFPRGRDLIVYGRQDASFLPRVWFSLHHALPNCNVHLLDGSLEDWIAAGGAVEENPVEAITTKADLPITSSKPSDDEWGDAVWTAAQVQQVLSDENTVLLDARSSSFAKGSITGAQQVAYSTLLEQGRFKSPTDLQTLLNLPETTRRVVCTCGSGVSACSLVVALREIGFDGDVHMYDGSWQEWKTLNDSFPKTLPE